MAETTDRRKRNTEKTSAVLAAECAARRRRQPDRRPARQPDMGAMAPLRLPAQKVPSRTPRCIPATGARMPEGKVYRQKEPETLVRIVGQAPLEATVFEMERLRCNACGQVFTAEEPEGRRGRKSTMRRPWR
jgi:transposase